MTDVVAWKAGSSDKRYHLDLVGYGRTLNLNKE